MDMEGGWKIIVEMEDLETVFEEVRAKLMWSNCHHLPSTSHCYHETLCKDTVRVGKYICKVTNIFMDKTQVDPSPHERGYQWKIENNEVF